MFEIIESVITSGKYELSDMLKKIDAQWIKGNITDVDKDKLIRIAREKANPSNSIDQTAKLIELERRIRVCEEIISKLSVNPDEPTDDPEVDSNETPPDFVIGKHYYAGDEATFNGKVYTCIAPEGAVCVWSPADYPVYWEVKSNE